MATRLEYVSFWSSPPSGTYKGTQARLVVNVLPRCYASLRADIERMHLNFELRGSKVSVHAPNSPQLARCTQCSVIGHASQACPLYSGRAIRLLFQRPVHFGFCAQLQASSGARIAYLGAGINEQQPSRRMTLLFAASSGDEAADMALIMPQLLPALMPIVALGLLHCQPRGVSALDRERECVECGTARGQPHDCPFAFGRLVKPAAAARSQPVAPGEKPQLVSSANDLKLGPSRLALPSAAASSAPRPAQAASRAPGASVRVPMMCRHWRDFRACKDHKAGKCPHGHPEEHVQPDKPTCQSFLRKGACSRGDACSYLHVAQPVPAPAPLLPSSAAAAAPAQPAPLPEVAAEPASQPSGKSKKRKKAGGKLDSQPAHAAASASQPSQPQLAASSLASLSGALTGNPFSALSLDEQKAEDELMNISPRPASPQRAAAPPSSLASLASPAKLQLRSASASYSTKRSNA